MAYLIKAGIGLALFFGGVIAFNVGLQEVLDIGTCASGNVPFEIRGGYECPEGTSGIFWRLFLSIPVALIGAALFAFRGDPPWGEGRKSVGAFGWGTLAWGGFFAGTGVALLLGLPYGEITNEQGEVVGRPDSELGAKITAVTFLVMGVPALLIGLWSAFKGLTGRRDERPVTGEGVMRSIGGMARSAGFGSSSAGSSSRTGGGDTIGRIERLQKLKESGAITAAEFDKEKAKILAEQ